VQRDGKVRPNRRLQLTGLRLLETWWSLAMWLSYFAEGFRGRQLNRDLLGGLRMREWASIPSPRLPRPSTVWCF
jgi:hypothetical protein